MSLASRTTPALRNAFQRAKEVRYLNVDYPNDLDTWRVDNMLTRLRIWARRAIQNLTKRHLRITQVLGKRKR
eukprot:2841080-Prymnesium_polylepis.2